MRAGSEVANKARITHVASDGRGRGLDRREGHQGSKASGSQESNGGSKLHDSHVNDLVLCLGDPKGRAEGGGGGCVRERGGGLQSLALMY